MLANSGHEPFGLVGLEVMAAGGVAFVGSTGEDYAVPFLNGIVLDTDDPTEINIALDFLRAHPDAPNACATRPGSRPNATPGGTSSRTTCSAGSPTSHSSRT